MVAGEWLGEEEGEEEKELEEELVEGRKKSCWVVRGAAGKARSEGPVDIRRFKGRFRYRGKQEKNVRGGRSIRLYMSG